MKPNKHEFEKFFFEHSNEETAYHFNVCKTTIFKWARKFNTARKCGQHKNQPNLKFSNEQIQILTGSLLGDGSLGKIHPLRRNEI